MATLDIPLPVWINRLPKSQRKAAKQRFLLKLAALYASEAGTLRELSRACGYSDNSFASLACRDTLSPETANRIEGLLGRQLFARERLCPHIYESAEASGSR